MTLKSQAATAFRWASVSSVCVTVAEVARTVVLARYLSPVDFGLMGMVLVVIGLAQTYADLGISAALIHRQDTTPKQLSSLYWLNVFGGLIMFAATWLCIPLIAVFFKEPRLLPLLKTVSGIFIIMAIGQQFEVLLQRELSFKILAKVEVISAVGSLVVGVVLAVTGAGVWTLIYSFLAGAVLKTILLIRYGVVHHMPSLHFKRADLDGFISFGLYQMGERTLNYLGQRFDQILIGALLGAEALGFYNFAFNLTARPVSRINPIVTRVAFPVFSRVQHDLQKLRKGYMKVISSLAAINAPLLIGLAAVAPIAVPYIFGAKWAPSIVLIQILCFVALSRSLGNPIGSLQLAKGRADLGFWWNLAVLVLSVPTIYMGGKLAGATGIGLALLFLQIVLSFASYTYLIRPLIGHCAREYANAALKPLSMACAMGLIVLCFPVLYKGLPIIAQVIAQVLLGALVYITLMQVFQKNTLTEFRLALLYR
jgi:lipopolysaccharide exporter